MESSREPGGFVAAQDGFFESADEAHYSWQTRGPYFSGTEANLLGAVPTGERLLEIGCGEGANLFHLEGRAACRGGIDRSFAKLRFAKIRLPSARFLCADAVALPFQDAWFDTVLIRDLLHHLPDSGRALREAFRVLRPGGTVTLIEPNGRSPLIWLQGALVPEERRAWRSSGTLLVKELRDAGFAETMVEARQALPLHRVALHYRYGRPSLGELGGVRRFFDGVEAIARRVLPETKWLYLVVRARRPDVGARS